MEKTKNIIEDWAETQKKMYETWTNQAQEFQKNLLDGKVFTKGQEIFHDLLKKQQEGFQQFSKTASKISETVASPGINPFDNFFNQWKNIQDKTVNLWSDSSKKMQSFFTHLTHDLHPNGPGNTLLENANRFQDAWINALKSMTGAMRVPFDSQVTDFAEKTVKQTFSSMQRGTDNFMKLYELWAPVFKAMQNNIVNTEEYKRLMNPVLYKELMDRLFNFDTLSPLKNSYDQFMKTVSTWYENLGDTGRENYEAFKSSLDEFSKTIPKNQEFLSEIFKNISGQLKTSVSPFFRLIPESKEKEQMELINKLADFYIDSANKLATLQYLVYLEGVKVNDNILEDLAEKTKKGQNYENFSDFYTHWVNVNGKAFEEFFSTNEFSKLQGELVTLDAKIRSTTDNLMEYWLSSYPVVLKSQLDEVYKSNYELKKQVYQMGKQISILEKEKAATHAKEKPAAKVQEPKLKKTVNSKK